MGWPDVATALLAASALHAGFSVVVSVVVYPALADVPDRGRDDWPRRHADHSRRIGWVVSPLYLLVAAACAAALVAGPDDAATWLALVGNAGAASTTAAAAAPTHARLGRDGPAPALLARLLRVDRVRTGFAVLALGAALLAT